ncbi:DNA-binding response OmpR family regulator [Lentzea flaviverrucosa]|uniref:DNA-binding response regulator, OmpR family, contains REC and winged-helix (WHTH) domain n=1 Tax=Lentzea flaviverrucosa TaxID=200379 RepID=A0A1H9XWI0_9PSEU|nr:DNA-binding response OmpR family regulator [Lentzea flaviverrucosa]SES50520.1 DNA-binding response regulator, OmpR family, contains REC and winged-helix (wHTH) domain [Lentzea flaviverrucosa]
MLVVEDEKEIRELLRRYLERAGFTVVTTGSGAQALTMVAGGVAALVVLDLGLPDVDGVEVLRAARQSGQTPVVVLTARGSVEERIRGLELGADDYVTKPFSPTELVLRVQAVLHRVNFAAEPAATSFGEGRLLIDDARHEARWDGGLLELTPTEWGILSAVASVPGRVYSRYELINRVRGYEFEGYERTVDSHVKNLRHKLGGSGPDVVQTVLGVGYRLGLRRDP